MKLIAYPTSGGITPEIRPASPTRDWMDATPDRFAYRCLPLNIANSHGWEVLSPSTFVAWWDGGPGLGAVHIESSDPPHLLPVSHFGSGVLTFHVHALIRTEPGYNLWVGGSPNRIKEGISPLTGVIETDWSAYSFTMNWKFTRVSWPVRFEKGEPICFFFPVQRGLIGAQEPELRDLDSDPELARQYREWVNGRRSFLDQLPVEGSDAQKQSWQKSYFRGNQPDGSPGPDDHQTKLAPEPFADRRSLPELVVTPDGKPARD
jgi:hypothetical protein